jgi:hypothetical protein
MISGFNRGMLDLSTGDGSELLKLMIVSATCERLSSGSEKARLSPTFSLNRTKLAELRFCGRTTQDLGVLTVAVVTLVAELGVTTFLIGRRFSLGFYPAVRWQRD